MARTDPSTMTKWERLDPISNQDPVCVTFEKKTSPRQSPHNWSTPLGVMTSVRLTTTHTTEP